MRSHPNATRNLLNEACHIVTVTDRHWRHLIPHHQLTGRVPFSKSTLPSLRGQRRQTMGSQRSGSDQASIWQRSGSERVACSCPNLRCAKGGASSCLHGQALEGQTQRMRRGAPFCAILAHRIASELAIVFVSSPLTSSYTFSSHRGARRRDNPKTLAS